MSNNDIDKGIITYIYLENFVTYDKVCVKPGRNLNVIIGPNGTGKSTIVCAIVLGLGGKPTTIGRATHVADYIKRGCEEAKIEIHLKNGKSNDIVIQRIFNKCGKSFWFLDNRQIGIKEIQELTASLNIQVDNLCQFLPQDKVQDFSKMNAQELLENTERSVCSPIIVERHKNLIQYRIDHKDLEKQIESKKKSLELKTQIYDSLKESVSSIKEKKLIKEKILHLKQKKAWILYEQKRKELVKLKDMKNAAQAEVAHLEAEIKPVNDAITEMKSEIQSLQTCLSDHKNKVKIKDMKLKKMIDNIVDCENDVKDCENSCKQRIQVEEARDHDIDIAQKQKKKLDNDLLLMLKDIGSEEILVKQRQEIISDIEKKRNIINMLVSQASESKQKEDQLNLEIASQEAELQALNIEAKRLQFLRERSVDTYKAVQWLRENRNKFSNMIHEPILLNINVKEASYAKYLENIFPFRDMIAFVCEDKQDMNMLLHYLRDEQNLQVNVVHSDPAKDVSMNPIVPLQHIKQFGFTHYLVSLIEAPSTILKYLVSMYNLNNIPIGKNQVDDNVDRIPNNIRCYFSQNNVYMVNRSKYTGEKSIGMQPVSGTGMLSIVLDRRRMINIEEKLKELRAKKNKESNKLKQLDEQVHEQNKELDKIKATRNKYQQDLQQIQTLKSKIHIVEKKVVDLQNGRTTVEEIKKYSTKEIKKIMEKQIKIYKAYNTELVESVECIMDSETTDYVLALRNRSLRVKINNSHDLRERLKEAEDKVKQLCQELQPLKHEVQRVFNQALQSTNGISASDSAFAPIKKIFNKLPPTIEEINNELNIAQAKMFCMGNNIDGENILQEYEQVEQNINQLKDLIQSKTQELQETTQNIESLRKEWLTPLSQTIEKINSNFSMYFSAMDCAGEVVLAQPENHMEFDQYGLKIRVKFRNTDQLQELTRYHQSGGERAVTTAIYMIALQELSRVPFRCVDEINQGMDAVNERRVFNLLVKMTGRANSSQYFLLTPKLLPDLQYSETVTVHCVFNGAFMINHTEFDTEKYCEFIVRAMERECTDDN
ncbi:structural maintenance of chromosomes protein 5 [Bombus pyrosoma]|uniref:structural maintenance of chromosomes protein 5 n=1 Tax=Bombus pyrosoma TaxID=396416 RepID=UPI001CB9CDFD|nr:structural maintenance of chromosomes protein 5 [Bombus pyrosoma]XP_043597500.1 structural maintenance of chromosomes protein 5 [Bombus pyrosoma]XP_043597501.1 structural maintenance of chromosomes protein 5 [Bombus pyrosoma]XP_043597502.1 structural maintenance of chromosomes protein 5 [Bombus pyrosoma]